MQPYEKNQSSLSISKIKIQDSQAQFQICVNNIQPLQIPQKWMKYSPFKHIGLLLAYQKVNSPLNNIKSQLTAFSISPNIILTCAHGKYLVDKNTNQITIIRKWLFFPGHFGTIRYEDGIQVQDERSFEISNYINQKAFDLQKDFCIMKLKKKIQMSYLPLCDNVSKQIIQNQFIHIYGYPTCKGNFIQNTNSKNISKINQYGLYMQKKTTVDDDNNEIIYGISTKQGQSGCPIMLYHNGKFTIIGIHSRGLTQKILNKGLKFNKNIFLQIIKWIKQLNGQLPIFAGLSQNIKWRCISGQKQQTYQIKNSSNTIGGTSKTVIKTRQNLSKSLYEFVSQCLLPLNCKFSIDVQLMSNNPGSQIGIKFFTFNNRIKKNLLSIIYEYKSKKYYIKYGQNQMKLEFTESNKFGVLINFIKNQISLYHGDNESLQFRIPNQFSNKQIYIQSSLSKKDQQINIFLRKI